MVQQPLDPERINMHPLAGDLTAIRLMAERASIAGGSLHLLLRSPPLILVNVASAACGIIMRVAEVEVP